MKTLMIFTLGLTGAAISQGLAQWQEHFAQGEWELSYDAALVFLNSDSSNAEAWAVLSLSASTLGLEEEASELAARAISLDSVSSLAITAEAWTCTEDDQRTMQFFERALGIQPSLVVAMVGRAHCLMLQERYQEAIEQLEKALAVDPDWISVWYKLSEVYRHMGDFRSAMTTVDRAMEKWPGKKDLLLEAAWVMELLGRYQAAEAVYRKIIDMDPLETGALIDLGLMLEHRGDFGKAVKVYRKLLRRDPDYHWALGEIGLCLETLGNMDAAERSYLEGIEIDPEYAFAYYRLAMIAEDDGSLQEAMEWYTSCVENDPSFVEAWVAIGLLHEDEGDYTAAESAYRQALDQDPDYAWVWGELGLVLEQQGKTDEAGLAYEKGIAADSNYTWAWEQRGILLEDSGDLQAAADWYSIAVEATDDPGVWLLGELGFVLQQLGDDDRAAVYYSTAIEMDSTYTFGLQRLAPILADRGDYTESLEVWDSYLLSGGYEATALAEKLMIYEEMGMTQAADSLDDVLESDYPFAWVDLGWTYTLADPEKSRSLAQRAENQAGADNAELRLLIADLYAELDDPSGAGRNYAEAAAMEPDSIDVWLGWAYYLFEQDREEEAAEKYERAIALDSLSFSAWSGLGEALLFADRYDESLDALERSLKLNSSSPWVYAYMGLAWEQKGDSDRAMDYYFQALAISPGYDYAESRIRGITDTGFDPDWNRRRWRRFTATVHIDLRVDNGNVRERDYSGGVDLAYQYDSRGSEIELETDYRFIETSKEYANDYSWTMVSGSVEKLISDNYSVSLSSSWDRQPGTVRPWQISSYVSLAYKKWMTDWFWFSPSIGLGQVNAHWASGLEDERTDRSTVYGSLSLWFSSDESPLPSLWLWGNFYLPPHDSRHTIMNGLAELTFEMWDPLSLTLGYSVGYTRTPAYEFWDKYDTEFYSQLNVRLF